MFSRSMVSKSGTSECPPLQEVQEGQEGQEAARSLPPSLLGLPFFCFCVLYLQTRRRDGLELAIIVEARSTRPAHVACNTGDFDNPPSKHSGNNGGGWYF